MWAMRAAQERIQWGSLLCTSPKRAVEGVWATQVEITQAKWPTGKNHVAPQPSNTRCQQRCECSLKHWSVYVRRFTVDSIEMELVVVVEECKSAVITYTPYIAIIHSVVFCSYCTVQPCVRCRLYDVTVLTHKQAQAPICAVSCY